MDAATETTVYERTLSIDASPETVWEFLVDPEKAKRWMGMDLDLDTRAGGGRELLLDHRFVEGGLHDIAQHFLAHLLPELLAHHLHGHLARAEALQADCPAHALQPFIHGLFDAFGRDLHFHPAFQGAGRFN